MIKKLENIFRSLSWDRLLLIMAGAAIGACVGLGAYTFIYAKGYSYLSNDPRVCVNCHVMGGEFDGWVKSTHHAAALCNDCHTPHNLIGKYTTKARNGFWHSFYFTTGLFPDNIQTKSLNRRIAEENCRRCHEDIVSAVDGSHAGADKLSCVKCHGSVGHPNS